MQSCAYVASCWPCRLWRMFWAVSRQFGRFWFRFWKGFGKFKFRTRFPRRERRSRRPLYFWRSDGEYFKISTYFPKNWKKTCAQIFFACTVPLLGITPGLMFFSPTVFRDRVPGRFGGGSGGFQTGSGRVRGRFPGHCFRHRVLDGTVPELVDGGTGFRDAFPWWPALVLV